MPGGDADDAQAGVSGFEVGGSGPATAGSAAAFAGSLGDPGGGGAGQAGSGVAGTATGGTPAWVPQDYGWAAWPMPNAASSGLPNPASYDVSVPGIVSDLVTGLMWQAEPLTAALPWMETKVGCEMLTLGGYDDWRLPSRIELVSLLAFEPGSMTDSRAFPLQSPPEQTFWSASPYASDPSMQVWLVSAFKLQTGYATTVGGERAARCVRSTRPAPSEPHYTLHSGVVQDRWTGLTWERQPPAYWQSLDEVRDYCAALVLADHDDWYLPSLKELLTIVDEKRAQPALDTTLFPGTDEVINGWFWTSTHFPVPSQQPLVAPGLRFADGLTEGQDTATSLLSRCVRQGHR